MKHAIRIFHEIDSFSGHRQNLIRSGFTVEELDSHGIVLRRSASRKGERIDLLITALIHGDEVVGIEAINLILSEICASQTRFSIDIGFLLCNVEAAKAGVRFLETDLNRSFLHPHPSTNEQLRASQISSLVKNADFTLDLHQTVEPTECPFFIFEHRHDLVEIAHALLPQIPIVTFPAMGFSGTGKTLLEFASTQGNSALGVEWGQKGFSTTLAALIRDSVFELIGRLSGASLSTPTKKAINVFHIIKSIDNSNNTRLVPGLTNFMPVKKGQAIARSDLAVIEAPFDCRLFFPKYGELAEKTREQVELAVESEYRQFEHYMAD